MLVLLLGAFLIASCFVLYRKRSMESFFLSGMCISLILQFCGILIFVAKKGGYSREMLEFLFVSMELKTKIQYPVKCDWLYDSSWKISVSALPFADRYAVFYDFRDSPRSLDKKTYRDFAVCLFGGLLSGRL